MVVVAAEPRAERVDTMVAGVVDRGVGPFEGKGLVEPLGFAVRPEAVRLDEALPRAEGGEDVTEIDALAVSKGVVAHDPLDADAVTGAERAGAGDEPSAGGPSRRGAPRRRNYRVWWCL